MQDDVRKYLLTECLGSAIVNGLLNLGTAWLLFRARVMIPVGGPTGLVQDLIGETFLVTFLSYMVACLISRSRRRSGKLPRIAPSRSLLPGNLYVRSLILGLLFTLIFVPLSAWLLPRGYPGGLSFQQVIWFKTIYGGLFGAIASYLAISRSFREPGVSTATV